MTRLAEDLRPLRSPPGDRRSAEDSSSAQDGLELSWPTPPQHYPLSEGAVHVWCLATDVNSPSLTKVFSADERHRSRQYRFEKDRARFLMRRWLLRTLLGGYLDVEPESVSLAYEAKGKPVLSAVAPGRRLHFSVSHSEDLALLAFCRQSKIGVDVERVRPIPLLDQIAAKTFSMSENLRLEALPERDKLQAFFNAWTGKEAVLKATGEGISGGLDRVEVAFSRGESARVLLIDGDATGALPWSLHALSPAKGFVGAVAVYENQVQPSCWSWRAWPTTAQKETGRQRVG